MSTVRLVQLNGYDAMWLLINRPEIYCRAFDLHGTQIRSRLHLCSADTNNKMFLAFLLLWYVRYMPICDNKDCLLRDIFFGYCHYETSLVTHMTPRFLCYMPQLYFMQPFN